MKSNRADSPLAHLLPLARALVFVVAFVLPAVAIVLPAVARRADDASQARQLFELMELKPGMTVAEIGGGKGEMTVEMARQLGPEGSVYSSELSADRRADIRKAADQAKLTNVIVVESSDATANLPAGCCDAIFMRDVYHHFTKPAEMDRSLVAALKPGGRLSVIDFEPGPGTKAPDGVPANRGGHGIHPATVIEELSSAGMTSSGPSAAWPNEQTPQDRRLFIVLFRKPAS
jgi:predicted methyltransferase